MAVTYEAANFTPFTSAVSTFSFTPDGGVAADDFFVVMVSYRDNRTITLPSGAVEIVSRTAVTAADRMVQVFGWKATSSSTSAVNIAISGGTTVGAVAWARFRGVSTTTPLSGTPGVGAGSLTAPSVTTTVANAYVLAGCTVGSGSTTISPPAGFTTRVTSTQVVSIIATEGAQASPGATGTAVFTSELATRVAWQVALTPADAEPPAPELLYSVVGAPTSTGFTVATKVPNAASVRVKAGTNSGVTTGVVYGTAGTPDGSGWSKSTVTGLSAATQYYYAIEITDDEAEVTTTAPAGRAKTLPSAGAEASFTFAFGSCYAWENGTEGGAFTRALARNPDLFFHLGDFHYQDSVSTSQASHLADIEETLGLVAPLQDILAQVPTVYVSSDHDSGDNGSFPGTQTTPNRNAKLQVFPYLTRPDSTGFYHSMVVGRVRFIFTDTRSFAATNGSTRLGATQKAWFKAQLQESEPVKVWVQESTWIDDRASTKSPDDVWDFFNTERVELGNFIASSAVGQVITVHGDQHALSADDGSHNPWGGFPSFCAAPFMQWSSLKASSGSRWSEGYYPSGSVLSQQHGFVTVTDTGDDITLAFRGYDTGNTQRVALDVVVEPPVWNQPFTGVYVGSTAAVRMYVGPTLVWEA